MKEDKDILFKPDAELVDKEYIDYTLNYIIDMAEKVVDRFKDKLANPLGGIPMNTEWIEEAVAVNSKAINTSKSIKKKLEQEEPLTYEEMYSILEIMYDLGASDEKIRQKDQKTWLTEAKVGDKIYDKLTHQSGELQQIKKSPEGSILFIKFDNKLIEINLLEEMREPRRYYKE